MPLFASYRDHVRLEAKVDEVLRRLHLINERILQLPTAADIKAKIDILIAKVQANTDATSAVKTYVEGLKAQLTDVQAQLAAAIAANDTTALQDASDALDAVIQNVDADTAAEAALTNTPAQP